MINQHACQKGFLEGMNITEKDKKIVEKTNVRKTANIDITQTKEFWSKLAVIS